VYSYDAFGRIVQQQHIRPTVEPLSQRFIARPNTQTFSLVDPSSQLITQSSTLTFAHDGHGSVRVLFGAAATIAQVFTYSAYGELLAIQNGSGLLTPNTSSLTAYLYNGEGLDARTGLYNMRARWYSASNARWERLDPFAGNPTDPFSFNKYGFVHADPVQGIDPTGENLLGVGLAIGVVLLVLMNAKTANAPASGDRGSSYEESMIDDLLIGGAVGVGLNLAGRFIFKPLSSKIWSFFVQQGAAKVAQLSAEVEKQMLKEIAQDGAKVAFETMPKNWLVRGADVRGAALSVVRDGRTGEIFFGFNDFLRRIPERIHPILKERYDEYLTFVTQHPENAVPQWGVPGWHAEFFALNEALLRRESLGIAVKSADDLAEFGMYNAWLWKNRLGEAIPRCGHCRSLTEGVKNYSGDLP
jgi:RHS repeat-associated protein